jgi:tetratricopeptide (TPR) repeat protein
MPRPSPRLVLCATCLMIGLLSVSAGMAQSQSPPAQGSRVGAPAQPQTNPSPSPSSALTPEQRIALLEERMNTTLAMKQEEIEALKDRITFIQYLVTLVGGLGALVIVALTVRDFFLRRKEGERQRGMDEIFKDMIGLQNAALSQQNRLSTIQVKAAEEKPAEYLQRVQNVNQVIDTVQKTLAFRLEQEQKVADVIKTFEKQEAERERKRKEKLDAALSILEGFRNLNRMQFSTLTSEQHKRAIKLVEKVGDLEDSFSDGNVEPAGSLLYTCGAITYYDEDIIQARAFFDHAALRRARDHAAELNTDKSYRKRFAFIHYFRAIIQKNWGELSEALHEIEQSDKLLKDDNTEFLTPTTKAEIRSYIEGDEQRCRAEVIALLDRLADIEKVKNERNDVLNANQMRLRNRLLLLLGNADYVAKDYQGALAQYEKAIKFNPNDYYALASAAQCCRKLDDPRAKELFQSCLNAIEQSDDFVRKRERITRAVIAVLAANAAKACGDAVRYTSWARDARELLEGDLSVDGLSPRFFSPSTKRLVSAAGLLNEIEELSIGTAPSKVV